MVAGHNRVTYLFFSILFVLSPTDRRIGSFFTLCFEKRSTHVYHLLKLSFPPSSTFFIVPKPIFLASPLQVANASASSPGATILPGVTLPLADAESRRRHSTHGGIADATVALCVVSRLIYIKRFAAEVI